MGILLADLDRRIGSFLADLLERGAVVATQMPFGLATSTQRWKILMTSSFVASSRWRSTMGRG
jgi:hypothetical protein